MAEGIIKSVDCMALALVGYTGTFEVIQASKHQISWTGRQSVIVHNTTCESTIHIFEVRHFAISSGRS